jgi:hypothetical protein
MRRFKNTFINMFINKYVNCILNLMIMQQCKNRKGKSRDPVPIGAGAVCRAGLPDMAATAMPEAIPTKSGQTQPVKSQPPARLLKTVLKCFTMNNLKQYTCYVLSNSVQGSPAIFVGRQGV